MSRPSNSPRSSRWRSPQPSQEKRRRCHTSVTGDPTPTGPGCFAGGRRGPGRRSRSGDSATTTEWRRPRRRAGRWCRRRRPARGATASAGGPAWCQGTRASWISMRQTHRVSPRPRLTPADPLGHAHPTFTRHSCPACGCRAAPGLRPVTVDHGERGLAAVRLIDLEAFPLEGARHH